TIVPIRNKSTGRPAQYNHEQRTKKIRINRQKKPAGRPPEASRKKYRRTIGVYAAVFLYPHREAKK
ncbi:hypothetical protein, partial [Thiolapillus sp.]|uniref:hypothetical protein n=1 Tax=Thiolapillus sp. TaxID=2017437 RepID=UPI003AF47160